MAIFTCKDCPDRYLGCHGNCRKYRRAQEENQKRKDYLNADKDFDEYKFNHLDRRERKSSKKNKW